jgi:transcriptional regulator with XRE-family HTH domain
MKYGKETSKIIRQAYLESGMTQQEISTRTDYPLSTVLSLTSDRLPAISLVMAAKFAGVLNIPPDKIADAWEADKIKSATAKYEKELNTIKAEKAAYIKQTANKT